jgi:hypothetical protein
MGNPSARPGSWRTEVGSRSHSKESQRKQFYQKVARLRVQTNPDNVLDDPNATGLKAYSEIKDAPEVNRKINAKDSLSKILRNYFKDQVGITDKTTRGREVALSLYYLTQQQDTKGRSINVDYLNVGWGLEIKNGQLTLTDRKGEKVIDGAYLRKPETTPKSTAQEDRDSLKEEIDQKNTIEFKEVPPGMPEIIYKFKRSIYNKPEAEQMEDALIALLSEHEKADPDKDFTITITGTADKKRFEVEWKKGKKRVNLDRGRQFKIDYFRALQALKANGMTKLQPLNLAGDGIYAIHDLPYAEQQEMMNHAIAYLRAEKLREDLKARFPEENVKYKIDTKWIQDNDTRVSTIVDVQYTDKPKVEPKPDPVDPKPDPVEPKPDPVDPKPDPVDPNPKPKPDPDKPKKPEKLEPAQIIKEIESIETDKYKISREAIHYAGNSITGLTDEETMKAPETIANSKSGDYTSFFVIDKSNPKNPPNLIVVHKEHPNYIYVYDMDYSGNVLWGSANVLQKANRSTKRNIALDNTNADTTRQSILKMFDQI